MVEMPRRVFIAEGCFIVVGWHDPLALVFMSLECPSFSHIVKKSRLAEGCLLFFATAQRGPNVIVDFHD